MRKAQSILISVIILITIFSCENDLEVINAFSDKGDMALQTMKDSEIIITDSGLIQVKITAPVIMNFPTADEPYIEFPNGFHSIFYDSDENPESDLTANYGIYYTQKALWEARDKVEVTNRNAETLNTEQLFWDEKKKLIYSNTFVKITSPDEIYTGEGMIANESFTWWKITKLQGEINLKDE